MTARSLLPRPQIPFIPTGFYARGCDWIETAGADRQAVLQQAGIEAATMESADELLTLEQVERFVTAAVRSVNERGRVIEFGSGLLFPSFGDLGLAALTAPTIAAVFDTLERFVDLVTPLFRIEQTRQGEYYEVRLPLRYGLSAEALRVHVDVTLSSLAGMVRTGASTSLESLTLDLPIEDPVFAAWASERGATVRTGQDVMAVRFPSELAGLRLALADPRAHDAYVARCEQSLANRRIEDQAMREVRGKLREVGPPFPDVDALSRTLGTSSRTLRRRLEREGVSYRQLFDEARFTWATTALRASERDITSIAYDLGYATPEGFSRAFRGALGVSPRAYRNGTTQR